MNPNIKLQCKIEGKIFNIDCNINKVTITNVKTTKNKIFITSDFLNSGFDLSVDDFDSELLEQFKNPTTQTVLENPVPKNTNYKETIFEKINIHIKNKNYKEAYNEISKLSFIKSPLAKRIFNTGNREFIKTIILNPKFANLSNYIEEVITESKTLVPIPFDLWKDTLEEGSWISTLFKITNTTFIEYAKEILMMKLNLNLTDLIFHCAETGKIEYLKLFLDEGQNYNIGYSKIKEFHSVTNVNKLLHVYILLAKTCTIKDPERDLFIKKIDEIILNNYSNLNIDTIYLYCTLTSFDPKNFDILILEKLNKIQYTQTLWFELDRQIKYSYYPVSFCTKELESFFAQSEKILKRTILTTLDDDSEDEYSLKIFSK